VVEVGRRRGGGKAERSELRMRKEDKVGEGVARGRARVGDERSGEVADGRAVVDEIETWERQGSLYS
jgi:hypothetical protein